MSDIIKKFASANAFLEWASHAPCLWRGTLGSRETSDNEWAGTPSYEAAYHLAKYGWPDGLKHLSREVEIARTATPAIPPPRRKRYDVCGHYPSPGRASAGEAFAMVNKGRDFKIKPVVKIRTNLVYPSNTPTSKIITWGAAICSYIDRLEQTGQSVQLTTIFESKPPHGYNGPKISFQFPLKLPEQQLSMASIVFWWAHPSSLRRIEFSAMERLDIEQWYSHGYGVYNIWTTPEPGTLTLSIDDATNNTARNIEIIRRKHQALLDQSAAPAPEPR